jgi:hypothetical protein
MAESCSSHSYHGPRYNGCSPRDQLGVPFLCAAGDCERRFLAASFASAAGSGMDGKLPRFGTGTGGVGHSHPQILQSWLRNRLSAFAPGPRLGCDSFFDCLRWAGAGYDRFCLRVRPRSDRTWEIGIGVGERGLVESASGPARPQARKLLSANISRPRERCSRLTILWLTTTKRS